MEGKTIVDVRSMTDEEIEAEGWTTSNTHGAAPIVLELDDGSLIFPSQDPEGNGPGALFGIDADGQAVRYFPPDGST